MQQKVLSIGIAAYNMEKYLRRCIDSLLIPDLGKLEIIIVNNASTDSTPSIAQEYKEKYPESVKVVNIDVNGHYGKAINHALKNATGKYFKLLDADDWYDTNGLTNLVNQLSVIDVDLIITNVSKEFANGKKSECVIDKDVIHGRIIRRGTEEFTKMDFFAHIGMGMHRIAYKTAVLKDMHFTMTENIPYVDNEYAYYPFEYIHSVIFIDTVIYKYYIGREGQTVNNSSMIKNSDALLIIIRKMLGKYDESIISPETRQFKTLYLCEIIRTYYHIKLVLQNKNKDDYQKLEELDESVRLKSLSLYKLLGKQVYYKIPYIYIWRKTGMHIIPANLYLSAKRLFRKHSN